MMKNKCERPCVWNSDHMERLNKHMLHFKKKKKKRKRGIVSEVAIFMEKNVQCNSRGEQEHGCQGT